MAEALFADGDEVNTARIDLVIRDLDDFLGRAGARPRLIFALCVTVLSWFAPLWIGRFTTLSDLSLSERSRALHKAEGGLLGPPVLAAKAILCVLWFEHPDVSREVRRQ